MIKKINPSPNYAFSIVSVSMLLFLLLVIGGFWIFSKSWMTTMKEDLNLVVELDHSATDKDAKAVTSYLKSVPGILPESIEFISKDDAFQKMRAEMGEDLLSEDFPNPLHDIVTVNLAEEYITPDHIKAIEKEIAKSNKAVIGTHFQESIFTKGLNNLTTLLYIGLAIVVLFLVVAVTIIFNTTKFSLFSNRYLIKNMELVGATTGFILRPFLMRSFRHGLLSALLAILLLAGVAYSLYSRYPAAYTTVDPAMMGGLLAVVLSVGLLINILTTRFIVKRYFRMRMNEMF